MTPFSSATKEPGAATQCRSLRNPILATDEGAVAVDRGREEHSVFAADAPHGVHLAIRAEQRLFDIAPAREIHPDARQALERVAGGDAQAVRIDEPHIVEPGKAAHVVQERVGSA